MRAHVRHFSSQGLVLLVAAWFAIAATAGQAADRAKLEAFLETTGFDVALESIRLSADSAPAMLGLEADDFGSEWSRLVREVFDTDLMREMGLEILGETLSDELLTHAADFYATDFGQRLVKAENASHMIEDDTLKSESGEAIIAGLVRIGSPRVALLRRLNSASNVEDSSIRAIQEVRIRFLMAAANAGVVELRMDETDLREALKTNEDALRLSIQSNALSGAAYTYQAFSDAEVETYAEALEAPEMQQVYQLMNAVQYEIMANRYEAVAERMRSMRPSQDL